MLALASPALLVILLLIVLPVGWLAWQSIYQDGFTLENYRRILSEDIYWRSFALTFEISLMVTLLALLLGYPVAYAASAVPKGWSVLILALVILPFWTSVLVRAYAWLALLQRTGVINQLLRQLGLIDAPLALVHNMFGTVAAVDATQLPAAKSIIEDFKKSFSSASDFGAYTMPAYDCAKILINAIGRAIDDAGGNMPTREQVRAQVAQTKDYQGALGTIGFDSNGDTTNRIISIYKIGPAPGLTGSTPKDWVWVSQVKK